MKTSCGIVLHWGGAILLAHPTNAPLEGSWMPSKGGLEIDESEKECAVRETFEEIGFKVPISLLERREEIFYTNRNTTKIYKTIVLFHVYLSTQFGVDEGVEIDHSVLPNAEMDKIKWVTKKDWDRLVHFRYKDLMK